MSTGSEGSFQQPFDVLLRLRGGVADNKLYCMLHSQILATWNFSTNHDIVPWIGEELHIGAEFQEFSRNDKYVRVPGKLSEIHSKVPMFSNPGDKVLKCVKTRGQICPVI